MNKDDREDDETCIKVWETQTDISPNSEEQAHAWKEEQLNLATSLTKLR